MPATGTCHVLHPEHGGDVTTWETLRVHLALVTVSVTQRQGLEGSEEIRGRQPMFVVDQPIMEETRVEER